MLFEAKKEKKNIASFLPVILLILVLIVFYFAAGSVARTNDASEKEILQNALDRGIAQCYALEGAYPSSLSYLVENYGLTYDSEHYFIDYQYIGSNLRPDTMIIERDGLYD